MIQWTWRETATLGSGLLFFGGAEIFGLPLLAAGGIAVVAGAAVGVLWPKNQKSPSAELIGEDLTEYLDQRRSQIGRIRNDLMKKFPSGIQNQVGQICDIGDSCRRYIRSVGKVSEDQARQLTEILNAVEQSLTKALPLTESDSENAVDQLQKFQSWLERIAQAIGRLNNAVTTGQSSSLQTMLSIYDGTLPLWGVQLDSGTEETAKEGTTK